MIGGYHPQTGSIAKRALNALSLLEPGTELSSSALLEAIGQPSDWVGIHACMEDAVTAGLVKKRTAGRLSFWSVPLAVVKPEAVVSASDVSGQQVAATTKAPPVKRKAAAAPQQKVELAAPRLVQTEDLVFMSESGFDCALSKSGRLSIMADGASIHLSLDYTQQLFQYLDRMREAA